MLNIKFILVGLKDATLHIVTYIYLQLINKTAEQNIKICKVTDKKPEVHLITNSLQFDDLVFREMLNLFKSNSIFISENILRYYIFCISILNDYLFAEDHTLNVVLNSHPPPNWFLRKTVAYNIFFIIQLVRNY